MRALGCLAAIITVGLPAAASDAAGRPTALLVGIPDFPLVDPQVGHALWEAGYNVATCTLNALTPESLAGCNVLVLTQFSVGPFPLSAQAVDALRRFVDEGGGVLFIAGIGGYGDQAELLGNLNAILAFWGA